MGDTRVSIFVHCVWATWNRLPLLQPALREPIYRAITAKCQELGGTLVAIGGIEDHVHVLCLLPATMAVARLIGQMKGASAHLATHHLTPGEFFRWQGGYAVFSVSPGHVRRVTDYINHQAEHHASGKVVTEWEE